MALKTAAQVHRRCSANICLSISATWRKNLYTQVLALRPVCSLPQEFLEQKLNKSITIARSCPLKDHVPSVKVQQRSLKPLALFGQQNDSHTMSLSMWAFLVMHQPPGSYSQTPHKGLLELNAFSSRRITYIVNNSEEDSLCRNIMTLWQLLQP